MNTWMNDVNYLASMAHIGWSALIVTTAGYLSGRHPYHEAIVLTVAALLIAFAAIKEFWYDANYELPRQTTKDNLLDFAGYCAGTGMGALLVFWIAPLCGMK